LNPPPKQKAKENIVSFQMLDEMRVVLTWGPVAKDLDLHVVEFEKVTNSSCHTGWHQNCSGSQFDKVSIN
jgi:hypothetical protein